MKKMIFISILATLATLANAQANIKTTADTINIRTDSRSTDDMLIDGEGPYTSGGGTGTPNPNWYLKGYTVNDGASFENINEIDLNGKYNNAISVNNNSNVTNSGTINLNSTVGVGILSEDGTGNIVNTSSGIINFTGGYGIASKGFSSTNFTGLIQNDGLIISDNAGTAIFVYGSQAKDGGTVLNNGTIKIKNPVSGATAVGITGHSTFTNNGEISGSNNSLYTTGALVTGNSGAQLMNSDSGVITGSNYANGMYANNSSTANITSATNNGIINVDKGYGIYSVSSIVENNGTISSNYMGIAATKSSSGSIISTVVNNGDIIIGNNGIGIQLNQSTGENNGELIFSGKNATGINIIGNGAYDGKMTNNSAITSEADKTGITLIKLTGSTTAGDKTAHLYNNAALTALGDDSTAIYSISNGRIHNTGDITVNNGTGIKLENSILDIGDNSGTITVKGNGTGILASALGFDGSVLNNDGIIVLENNGTGIYVSSGNKYKNGSTGINTGVIEFLGDGGTGIYVRDAKSSFGNESDLSAEGKSVIGLAVTESASITNTGNISLLGENSTGIDISEGGILESNTGNINVENGTGISVKNSELSAGQNMGTIYVSGENGTGIKAVNSTVVNSALINADNMASGMYLDSSDAINSGEINVLYGTGIKAAGSNVTNDENGKIIVQSGTGIQSEKSMIFNNGIIESGETGVYALNNVKTVNAGKISGKTGVEIKAGDEEFSGHFLNTGEISGTDYAVKFDDGNSVLELGNGSVINGKIDASAGENILIVNGDVKLDSADNFSKLVSRGNSEVSGTINLKPAEDYDYYTEAYTSAKNTRNIADETELGEMILSGTINVGVNYDGITDETNKTGKILTSGLVLKNGAVVLNNAGNTENDIVTESGMKNYGDQIRVKSIIISDRQQAVDPGFRFQTAGGMSEVEGWTRETVSRIENGVTVLDEVYTNNNKYSATSKISGQDADSEAEQVQNENSDSSSNGNSDNNSNTNSSSISNNNSETDLSFPAVVKLNSVPRNRVDLDNMNKLDTLSERFLNIEADSMKNKEVRQSIEYTGTKAGSYFRENNNFNYDYNVDSNGIAAVTLYKYNDNIYGGLSLGYTDNEVKYENNDKENTDSFNANLFGRYKAGNWNLDGHFGYGYNNHDTDIDWLMSGERKGNYKSHIFKTGISAGYEQNLAGTGLVLIPSAGVDYIIVNEGTIKTEGMSDIESTNGKGAVGKIGLGLGNTGGNFRWKAGVGYEQNFTDTFHNERKMVNGYTMEKLYYGKETLKANLDMEYKLSEKLGIKAGYEYENNSNYENHNFNMGITYTFGEK